MVAYADFTRKNSYFVSRRNRQAKYWMHETINEALKNKFYADRLIHEQVRELEKEVVANRLSPFAAAQLLLDRYFSLK